MSESKLQKGTHLQILLDDENMKKVLIGFFRDHAASIENYLEIQYAREFSGQVDPVIIVGNNSVGIRKINKEKGSVVSSKGDIVSYHAIAVGEVYASFDTGSIGIYRKNDDLSKDTKIGAGGSLDIVMEKMIEIESSFDREAAEAIDNFIESKKSE